VDELTRKHARRRAWRAFALWLVGYASVSGGLTAILEGPRLLNLVGTEGLAKFVVNDVIHEAPPRIAVFAACFASLTFAHHDRGPEQRAAALRALGPIFAVTPAGAAVAAAILPLSMAATLNVAFDVNGRSFLAATLAVANVSDVAPVLVRTCVDAFLLGPLAIFGLPILTHHVKRFGIALIVVWITVLASVTGIDTIIFRPLTAGDLPMRVSDPP
jgi:hypothetical protein